MLPSGYLTKGWCQGSLAINKGGEDRDPKSPQAARWCLLGAFIAADVANRESREVLTELAGQRVVVWNDDHHRTQQEVIDLARLVEMKLGLRDRNREAAKELEPVQSSS